MTGRTGFISAVLGGLLLAPWAPAALTAGEVADRVQRTQTLRCGVDATPGFNGVDSSGRPNGFDLDFCRAVAAAAIGTADAIETVRVRTAVKFEALTRDEIDVAFGQATWTFSRETTMGVAFPTWILMDGQGLLAWSDSGLRSLADARGRRICVQGGTTSEANLRDALVSRKVTAELVVLGTSEERNAAFRQRRCDLTTGDRTELAAQRATQPAGLQQLTLLPDILSREPLSPVVKGGDKRWFDIVRWTVFATIIAEEKGIGRTNAMATTHTDPEVRRLLGLEGEFGKALGLAPDWARKVIAEVGNYAEIYDRNLGAGSPIDFERGPNRLWRQGGMLVAPPFR